MNDGKDTSLQEVLAFANPDIEISSNDESVVAFAETIKANRWDVKAATGIGVSDKDTLIALVQRFLKKLGLGLKCDGRRGSRDNRQRIYKFVEPSDGRNRIFEAWRERDEAAAADLVFTLAPVPAPESLVSRVSNKYIDIERVDTNQQSQTLDTESEPAMIVACRRFGAMFKFRVEDFIATRLRRS